MTKETFTVDAKLLRELGERLVGRPHIALAELIKNSYDADARHVVIKFARDRIEVSDDGHGMSRDDFVTKWMRIGTVHKERARHTPELQRPYTGSKGVGRLAAQLLARRISISSVGLRDQSLEGIRQRTHATASELFPEVRAEIDWDDAIEHDDLTDIEVDVSTSTKRSRFAEGSACGTTIVLEGLTARWDAMRFRRLAQQIWALQPPFDVDRDSERSFEVTIESQYGRIVEEFREQMHAVLDIWEARVTAQLLDEPPEEPETFVLERDLDFGLLEEDLEREGSNSYPTRWLRAEVELRGSGKNVYVARVPHCRLARLAYEIRVFDLVDRQPLNVKVGEARRYLDAYGGVSVFDAGFRLPYYGADIDWLKAERDHARRLSNSVLLPEQLRVDRAMQDLPTNRRILGSAYVSTTQEAELAASQKQPADEVLTIQVTRDRLVENDSYLQLRSFVRLGLDLYATDIARTRAARAMARFRNFTPPSEDFQKALQTVRDAEELLPKPVFENITSNLTTAIRRTRDIERSSEAHTALLGALATAGMMATAYDHETSKQLQELTRVGRRLTRLANEIGGDQADVLRLEAQKLTDWVTRAQKLRLLFRPMADEEVREKAEAFNARKLIKDVVDVVDVLRRKTEVNYDEVPEDLTLPAGGFAAWSAVFQNILVNAFNATLEVPDPRVDIDAGIDGTRAWARIQDTGDGVDLAEANRLFEPFVRGRQADKRRAALGLGGSGLGLTIVRMITTELGVSARFDKPDEHHATSFLLTWKPKEDA